MEEKRFLLLPAYVAQAGVSLSTVGVMSFLPLFLAELYGSDSSVMLWAGLAAGMAPLAAAFSAPFWSLGACRWGPKRVMTAILLCLSLSLAFVSMAEKGWQVLAFRFLQGMAGGMEPVLLSAISMLIREERISEKMGYFQAALVTGVIFGPLLGGSLSDLAGSRRAFLLLSLIPLACFLMVWFHFPSIHYTGRRTWDSLSIKELFHFLKQPPLRTLAAVQVLCNMGITSMGLVLPLYIRHMESVRDGNAAALAGMVLFLCGTGSALSSFLAGKLLKRFSPMLVLGEAAFFISLSFCLQREMGLLPFYMACWCFTGLGMGLVAPSVNTMIAKSVSRKERCRVFGSLSPLFLLANGAGPFCSGFVTMIYGYEGAFLFSASTFCLAGCLAVHMGSIDGKTINAF